ncbi:uncharacterized protein STEHIDRAFT_120884 [Stereum hirsutum FP-91666 SS1]|uniref:uncharacterized protein n=1 Tax=Stereum hirsutum (strain FP-91666) TaxID=721885 RepID=UPI000440F375|nr:uncharacterized protein STEHIDRAFT_120884 [Stereum hirsutum FP-91666 SS1]EIM87166.1 hypothetical protein STEHIDRAFT_120884 [Stereum hirsutum FP-91666 SS1]
MQFSMKTAFFALAVFLPIASAASTKRDDTTTHLVNTLQSLNIIDSADVALGECKPLLQSCAVDSECCGDLCLLGLCLL